MSLKDREHFESYRAQTLAKHTILEKYIYAYFIILKGTEDRLVYIDGFAGRGTYTTNDGSTVPGSPLRALEKISSNPDLAKKVRTFFIEQDEELFAQLKTSLDSYYAKSPQIQEPQLANGAFSAVMTAMMDKYQRDGRAIAPMFVFVDPCGVDGVDFTVIERLLRSQRKCEIFLFFNIEGVRRILGLKEHMGETLAHLLGSSARAAELAQVVASANTSAEREEAIIRYYEDLLRNQTPGRFVVSFRVEREERRITSHYLVHVAQHPRGFAIMKDVMWSVGKTTEGKGGLLFEQASISTMYMLFTPEWDSVKASVLRELSAGKKPMTYFYDVLTHRPENRLCGTAYRNAILELEKEGKVFVLGEDGETQTPKRPRRNGVLTLSDRCHVTLR
ncbi:MAG: three-Cys-motif partner protein TcmP [Nannocystis sp.]|nr:three-Cys-motif partner protein TcmP [Nannocystis sp.]MBA3546174.1 three-Cys-motif partner protein TcmP [Nannocystis sp.]